MRPSPRSERSRLVSPRGATRRRRRSDDAHRLTCERRHDGREDRRADGCCGKQSVYDTADARAVGAAPEADLAHTTFGDVAPVTHSPKPSRYIGLQDSRTTKAAASVLAAQMIPRPTRADAWTAPTALQARPKSTSGATAAPRRRNGAALPFSNCDASVLPTMPTKAANANAAGAKVRSFFSASSSHP